MTNLFPVEENIAQRKGKCQMWKSENPSRPDYYFTRQHVEYGLKNNCLYWVMWWNGHHWYPLEGWYDLTKYEDDTIDEWMEIPD